jgi:lipoprotein-releasing system permease protein
MKYNYKLIFSISKSLLLARWKQTLVAAIGVTFSIAMFVTLLCFMTGLNDMLDGLILNRTPHIRLFNEIKPAEIQPVDMAEEYKDKTNFINSIKSSGSRLEIYNSLAVTRQLHNDARVKGISPKVTAQVFFNEGNIEITGNVNGIDVEAETDLFFFNDYVTSGNAIDIKNISNGIILGKPLADKMFADIGDVIQVTTVKGNRLSLKVVGYYQSGIADFDKVQSFASINTVQKLLGKPNNDVGVKLKDMEQAPALAKEYASLFGVQAEDIQTANAQFETGTYVRTIISYSVGITLLVVAGFGIYNILNMMIYEKMDSIAILKATGFSGKDVNRIFIVIALSIGFFGGMFGLFFGFLLTLGIDQIPFNTAALPTIKTFPINYNIKFYIIGTVFSLVTTYLAGWLPARKASGIDPVVIIRGK